MKRLNRTQGILVALSLVVIGCQSDMTIKAAYSPSAPLSGFGPSFAWMESSRSPKGDDSLDKAGVRDFIHQQIESEFVAKGYSRSSSPDFLIDYAISSQVRMEKPGWEVVPYTSGSLVLYVLNPESKKPWWSGSAETKLNDENPPEVRKQRIQQAVQSILKQFPSRPGVKE